jgi:hypothetical protein
MTTATTVPETLAQMTSDELADFLPLVSSNVMVALERHDLLGHGLENARALAVIASRAEAFFELWKQERVKS